MYEYNSRSRWVVYRIEKKKGFLELCILYRAEEKMVDW